jgi:hypothetical protein
MTRENQVFVVDVVPTNSTQEMLVLSVISRPIVATAELSAVTKICKYKGLHEGHHFILMAMEVHGTFRRDMDRFIRECVRCFHNR